MSDLPDTKQRMEFIIIARSFVYCPVIRMLDSPGGTRCHGRKEESARKTIQEVEKRCNVIETGMLIACIR